MSKIEDFENAPVGATATHANGRRAMKIDDGELRWLRTNGRYMNDEQADLWGFTLDPLYPLPTREEIEDNDD